MSCTKKVRRECSCGGTGKITEHYTNYSNPTWNQRGWVTYQEKQSSRKISCPCGGKGYYYETVVEHDWGPVQYAGSSRGQFCKKCGTGGWEPD